MDGIPCPKGCGEYENLGSHWGQKHTGELPDDVPTVTSEVSTKLSQPFTEEQKKALSETHTGGVLSEEQRRELTEYLARKWRSQRV